MMDLPDYQGTLRPTGWSTIRSLSDNDRRALMAAALRGCKQCQKSGVIENVDGTFEICHCVNRPEASS